MKKYVAMVLVFFIVSCKSKSFLSEGNASDVMSSRKIIENHYKNKNDFTTLYIKANAKYKDEKQSQNVTAEIRIRKDEKILVIVRFLGITMAKALITPKEVKYYEKIGGTFFEGNYQSLSQWLGTDLDFGKVQNLLIGEAIDDLNKGSFTSSIVEKMYKINNTDGITEKSFFFESERFLQKKQEIVQLQKERMFEVSYPNYQEYSKAILPTSLSIQAVQKSGKTNISIDYNSVTFNEDVSFIYSVPDGYDRKYID
jgi:hypothetical protein